MHTVSLSDMLIVRNELDPVAIEWSCMDANIRLVGFRKFTVMCISVHTLVLQESADLCCEIGQSKQNQPDCRCHHGKL